MVVGIGNGSWFVFKIKNNFKQQKGYRLPTLAFCEPILVRNEVFGILVNGFWIM